MSGITVREIIRKTIVDLGGKATNKEIFDWINENYPNNKESTVAAHLYSLSVNVPTRIHSGRNNKARPFNPDYDFLYKLNKNDYELYDSKKHGNYELIELNGKTVVAKDGIPISNYDESSLLKFLRKTMSMKANYQPIVLKILLEKGEKFDFSAPLQEIKENLQLLNFDREGYRFDDALKAFSSALSKFVKFDDTTATLIPEKIPDDISECLKICGQKIARWHVYDLTKYQFDLWSMMPGKADEGFPFLEEFLKTNSIGVGWRSIGNIENLSEEQVQEEFHKQYSEQDDASFIDFTRIKQKDLIVLTKGQQEIVDFGIVVSNYYHHDVDKVSSYPHRKNVVWLNQGPIEPNELPNKTLAGFMTTCGKIIKRREELVQVLLSKQTIAALKAHSCFILTQYSDSKYDDVEGQQYQYDNQKPNSRKLLAGSKFIIQSKIDNENCFVGYGKINLIEESSDTNEKGKQITRFVAKFSEYEKFEHPKMRTDDIYSEMKSMKAYGSQPPSILPITRQLYKKITGEDIDDDYKITEMKTDYSRTIEILRRKKNIILYGPPGTGKTYTAKEIAKIMIEKSASNRRHTWKSLATLVLLENDGNALNYHEISKRILSKDLIETRGQTPHETIAKDLRTDMEVRGEDSFFEKLEDGVYGLKLPATFSKAAEIVLFANNKPMHYNNIIEIVLEKEMVKTQGDTPEKTLLAEMTKDINENGENSTFVQIDSGNYSLRKQNPTLKENSDEQFIENITFHQSYGYEEFIEGIRPAPTDKGISYPIVPGSFKEFCNIASENSGQDFVMIIDEINRGNISKIFGELITIMENDKRGKDSVKLAYSKEKFTVPENIYIIGTMNTADQSLTHMDAALKRRFSLVEVMPDSSLLKHTTSGIPLGKILDVINDRIIINGSRDNQIGHAYFMNKGESIDSTEDLQFVFATDIIPLLRDYFYDDEESLKEILGGKFINWENPHRNMEDDWQDRPEVFIKTLEDAFGIQIDSD